MEKQTETIEQFVSEQNRSKKLFTAGPASLLSENITGLMPCFGRGDSEYDELEDGVLSQLKKMSGHEQIARFQGSASLALEVMSCNFLYGRVLVIETGYYSDRMHWLAESAMRRLGKIRKVDQANWKVLDQLSTDTYDWVVACPTETSCGLKIPIHKLHRAAKRLRSRLMLDATASIGLENDHHLADVIAYSSCKGLFGLTGAAFIAFNEAHTVEVDSFYLDLRNHLEKRMTGPYHSMASLANVLPKHHEIRESVFTNKRLFMKKFSDYLIYPEENQPQLCTYADCNISSDDPATILYTPRSNLSGSVVCHLGEVHLGGHATGAILNTLQC